MPLEKPQGEGTLFSIGQNSPGVLSGEKPGTEIEVGIKFPAPMSAARALPHIEESAESIRTRPCPECCLCNRKGELVYEGLTDRLYGAPGRWNLRRCLNPKCGMVWLDPIPVEEDISKAYLAYHTHEVDVPPADNLARRLHSRIRMGYIRTKYGYHPGGHTRWDQLFAFLAYLDPIRRANLDFSVFFLKSKPHGRLLELGCGSGAMLKSMKELGWQVEGVDFDPAAVEQARERGITVHLGTLTDQKFPDETFDAITASHFIEHIPDPLGMLQECRRLLKPGGLLVILTPNAGSWGHRIYKADWRGLEPPRHLHIFTPSSLARMCCQAGLNLDRCRSTVRGSGMLLASRMLRRAARRGATRFPAWILRVEDEMRSLAQWAVSFVGSAAGEEVLLISSK
jgi:2-polyprenyl-3-methyl-5-hydroxy-6-metoxy-1,4-benzoquinol methylase